MMSRQITTRQADAIIELVASLRPDWDKAGVAARLRHAATTITADPARLAVAAVLAANDATNLTPAVIAMQGKHWVSLDPNRTPEPTRATRCDCGDTHMPTSPCREGNPVTDEQVAEWIGYARTQVAERRRVR